MASRAKFDSQMISIDAAKQSVRTYLGFENAAKPLIMVGTYVIGIQNYYKDCLHIKPTNVLILLLIGKEKIWISIAETFDLKVWLEPNRRKAAECIFAKDDPTRQRIVDRREDANMHIVALGETAYPVGSFSN